MGKPLTAADRAASHFAFVVARLASPDVELDSDVWAELWGAFHRLRRSGATIDPALLVLMGCLQRQLRDTLTDGESDVDEFTEADDVDEPAMPAGVSR